MNTTAQTDNQNNDLKQTAKSSQNISVSSSGHKEQERMPASVKVEASPTLPEVSIPEEVEKAGVVVRSESVEIPPDLKSLGVKHAGPTIPMTTTPAATIVLPISDDQVISGLHQPIVAAIRWLSLWCMRQLKKAHLTIKSVHGKFIRVPINK